MGFVSNIPYVKVEYLDQGNAAIYFNRSWFPERVTDETLFVAGDAISDYLLSRSILHIPPGDERIVVRSRIARPFWWAIIRIRETLRTTKGFIIRVFGIWELANTSYALEYRWRDIRPIGWIGKKVGLWD